MVTLVELLLPALLLDEGALAGALPVLAPRQADAEAAGATSAESGIRGPRTGDAAWAVRARRPEAQERAGNTRSASSSRRPGGPARTMMAQVAPASARSRRCSASPSADPHHDTES